MNQVAESLELLIETMPANMSGISREDSLEIFNRICQIRDMAEAEIENAQMSYLLAQYNRDLRHAGLELAEAAVFVVREFDGTHRLAKAAARFVDVVANEGGRGGVGKP